MRGHLFLVIYRHPLPVLLLDSDFTVSFTHAKSGQLIPASFYKKTAAFFTRFVLTWFNVEYTDVQFF
jgi:hypothetical protein